MGHSKPSPSGLNITQNLSSLINTVPSFMVDEDNSGRLSELIQIMSSQFDELFSLIEHLPKIKRKEYKDVNISSEAIIRSKTESESHSDTICDPEYQSNKTRGRFEDPTKRKLIPDGRGILGGADLLSTFFGRDENNKFVYDLDQIRDHWIQNIYNNETEINKRKGTEEGFRNLIRCFGIDDELIKLVVYADNFEYEVDENQTHTVSKIKSLNCGITDHFGTTVHQNTGSETHTRNYIAAANAANSGQSLTLEANVVFPKVSSQASSYYVPKDFEVVSIFGMHKAEILNENLKVDLNNPASFQVQAVRDITRPNDVYFRLTSSAGLITELTSSTYQEEYDNRPWNLSLRIKPNSNSLFDFATGSVDRDYTIEFSGYSYDLDSLTESFELSTVVSSSIASQTLAANKRVYLGAHRENMTGSIRERTDLRFVSLSYWQDYLEAEELKAHAKDFDNIGRHGTYKNISINAKSLDEYDIRKNDSLALHWNFAMHTSSATNGTIDLVDSSSGSLDQISAFGHYGNVVGYQHPGKVQFSTISDKSIMQEFLPVSKFSHFENIHSSDQVQILDLDRSVFKRNEKPITFYYSFEKSMYSAISEEMLKYFAGLVEFNNLIGEPVNKYRQNYKGLKKLAQRFFEKSHGDLDHDRFIEYYKWVDDSISKFLDRLKPLSAKFSKKILNVIESHVFERNKYDHKFPTLEMKLGEPNAPILGINEMLYDWEHGHAPSQYTQGATGVAATVHSPLGVGNDLINLVYPSAGAYMNIVIPAAANSDGQDKNYMVMMKSTMATPSSGQIFVKIGSNDTERGQYLVNALNQLNNASKGVLWDWHADVDIADHITASQPNPGEGTGGTVRVVLDQAGTAGNSAYIVASNPDNANQLFGNNSWTSNNNFAGGADAATSVPLRGIQCLWWKDRATRESDLQVSVSVDKDRERQRVARNTFASGSTYVLRKLTRPYRFGVSMQTEYRSGQNRNTNKNDEFYKSVSKFGSAAKIVMPAADIIEDTYCNDVIDPTQKENFRIKSHTEGVDGYYDRDSDYSLPFSLFSSSAGSSFPATKAGVIVTNNHHDHYGDDHEVPLQGHFSEAHVGGMPHRHESIAKVPAQASVTIQADTGTLSTTTLKLTNTDGSMHTITAAALGGGNPSTATQVNTDLIGNANDTATQLKVSLDAAAAAGQLKMTVSAISNNSDGNPRVITLTQIKPGPYGNTGVGGSMVTGNKVIVNNLTAGAAHAGIYFTGGHHEKRLEAYKINSDASSIDLQAVPVDDPRSYYFRDGLAKRPLNIANLKYTTSSAVLGNYDKDYQVVMTNARSLNNNDLTDQEGFTLSSGSSTVISDIVDVSKPSRTKTEHIIVNRFSNPGPESAADSDGGYSVDFESGEYSVYNTINYKNSNTRRVLNRLYSEKSEQFGLRSGSANTLYDYTLTSSLGGPTEIRPTLASSVHMQNRNPHWEPKTVIDASTDTTGQFNHDNFVVYHQVPQNDIQYTWITASSTDTIKTFRGHSHNFTIPSSSNHQYPKQIQFVQKSEVASVIWDYNPPNSFGRIFGPDHGYIIGNTTMPNTSRAYVDFAGINSNIYEPVSASVNTLGYSELRYPSTFSYGSPGDLNYLNQSFVDGWPNNLNQEAYFISGATLFEEGVTVSPGFGRLGQYLNALLLHRQGPYGWPSWKQIRGGNHPVVRNHRKNNQYSIHFRDGNFNTSPIVDYDYSRTPDALNVKKKSIRTKNRKARNYFDIPVTSKFDPFVMMNFSDAIFRIEEDQGLGTGPQRLENLLWYLTDVSTIFTKGSTVFENLFFAVRDTYTNAVSTFSNPEIISALKIDEITHQPMESMMAAYQDDTRPNKPSAFHQINYIEAIYPREINTYTKNARNRTDFDFYSWHSTREERKTILVGNAYSTYSDSSVNFPKISPNHESFFETNSLFVDAIDYKNSGGTITQYITASTWPLDSRSDFSKKPLSLTASYTSTNSSFLANRDQGIRGEGELQNDYSIYGLGYNAIHGTPPPALVYSRRVPQPYGTFGAAGYEEYLAGESKWEANKEGDVPFYDSYSDYNNEIKYVGQSYSIVPEFKISDHIENVINSAEQDVTSVNFNKPLETMLSLTGGVHNTSHGDLVVGSDFYKTYSTTDFLKYFGTVQDSFEESEAPFAPGRLTLKCKGVLKFLPYRGFYPAERTTQIGEIFSKCYLQGFKYKSLDGSDLEQHLDKKLSGSLHHAIKPLMAPGVLYNSIKSGIAVDYPLFENEVKGMKAIGFININLIDESKTTWTNGSIASAGTYPKVEIKMLNADGTLTTKSFNFYSDVVDDATDTTDTKYVDIGQPPEVKEAFNRRSSSRNTVIARELATKLEAAGFELVDLNYLLESDYYLIKSDGSYSSGLASRQSGGSTSMFFGTNADTDFYKGVLPDPGEDNKGQPLGVVLPGVGLVSVPTIGGAVVVFRQPHVGSLGNTALADTDGAKDNSGKESSKVYFSYRRGRHNSISGWYSRFMTLGAGASGVSGTNFMRDLSTAPTTNNNLVNQLGKFLVGGVTGSILNNTKDTGIPRIKSRSHRRVSFEDLLEVESLLGARLPDNEPHPSASFAYGNSSWYKTFDYPFKFGEANVEHSRESLGLGYFNSKSDYTAYKMAINNFTAETVKFFLKDENLTSFQSEKVNFRATAGSTYKMRVYIHNQDIVMYDRHSAFGPACDAGSLRKETRTKVSAQAGAKAAGSFTVDVTDSGGSNNWTTHTKLNATSNGGAESNYPGIRIPLYDGSSTTNIDFHFYEDSHTHSMASQNTAVKYFINLQSASGAAKSDIDVANDLALAMAAAGFVVTSENNAEISFTQPSGGAAGNVSMVSIDGAIDSNQDANGVVKGIDDGGSNEGYVITQSVQNPQNGTNATGVNYYTESMVTYNNLHGYAPYVPPFLDPGAYPYVEFSFTAAANSGQDSTFTYDDLMSGMTLEYRNFKDLPAQTSSATNFQYAMCLSASLDLKSAYIEPTISREYNIGLNQAATYDRLRIELPQKEEQASSKRWSIQTKWETPILDFTDVPMSVLDLNSGAVSETITTSPWKREHWLTYLTQSSDTPTNHLTASRGMWHQKGLLPDRKQGYYMTISDVKDNQGSKYPSLGELVGFLSEGQTLTSKKVGEIAEEKEISEAVVAIPYFCDVHDSIQFFNLESDQISEAAQVNSDIQGMPRNEEYKKRWNEIRNPISYQMRMMDKYIFPPQFDFVQFPDKIAKNEAVAMYVFEFNAKLTKEDLKNIWQNTSPTSAESTAMPQHSSHGGRPGSVVDSQYVSHTLNSELENPLDQRFLKEEVRWLVFKVKKRAEKDYMQIKINTLFKEMEDSHLVSSDTLASLSSYKLSKDLQDAGYSYNWPYDFFSLVELVKVESKVDFESTREPLKP